MEQSHSCWSAPGSVGNWWTLCRGLCVLLSCKAPQFRGVTKHCRLPMGSQGRNSTSNQRTSVCHNFKSQPFFPPPLQTGPREVDSCVYGMQTQSRRQRQGVICSSIIPGLESQDSCSLAGRGERPSQRGWPWLNQGPSFLQQEESPVRTA